MRRVRGAVLLVLTLLAGACGTQPGGGGGVAETAGSWEELPASPLSPRSGTQAVWTGTEVLLWGGEDRDPAADDCAAGGQCAAPEPGPESREAAAYEPATGDWRRLAGTPPTRGRALWARGRVVDQSSSYDPVTGVSAPHPPSDVLVYADPQVIGTDLVVAGWDYGRGELGGVGQVVAAALDLRDPRAQWRQVDWPLPPPGAEGLQTATDGTDLLVLSWASNPAICGGTGDCPRLLRFSPATGTWTDLGLSEDQLQLTSGEGRIYALASRRGSTEVVEVDPADGSSTPLGSAGPSDVLVVSDTGRLAVVDGDGGAVRIRTEAGQWQELPGVPGDPEFPAVVWAGDDLVVWGGRTARHYGTRSSADGWTFRTTS